MSCYGYGWCVVLVFVPQLTPQAYNYTYNPIHTILYTIYIYTVIVSFHIIKCFIYHCGWLLALNAECQRFSSCKWKWILGCGLCLLVGRAGGDSTTVDGQNIQNLQQALCWTPNPQSQCFNARVSKNDFGLRLFRPLELKHLSSHEHWTLGVRGLD